MKKLLARLIWFLETGPKVRGQEVGWTVMLVLTGFVLFLGLILYRLTPRIMPVAILALDAASRV